MHPHRRASHRNLQGIVRNVRFGESSHPTYHPIREHHLDPTWMVFRPGEMTGYDAPRLPPRALVLLPDDVHVRVDRHARAVTFPSRPTRRRRRRSDPAVRSPPPPPGTVVAIVVAATAVPPSSVGISTPTTPPPSSPVSPSSADARSAAAPAIIAR